MSPSTGEELNRISVGKKKATSFFKLSFKLVYRLLQFLNPDPLRADEITDLHQVLQTLKIEDQTRETSIVISLLSPFRLP